MVTARTATDERVDIVRAFNRILTWARRVKPPVGLSSSAVTTLDTLDFAGPMRISDLVEREGISQPGMTGLINRLENEGLAVRTADPTDRRASLVALTDKGLAALDAFREGRVEFIAARISELDPADQAALFTALPAIDRLAGRLSGQLLHPTDTTEIHSSLQDRS